MAREQAVERALIAAAGTVDELERRIEGAGRAGAGSRAVGLVGHHDGSNGLNAKDVWERSYSAGRLAAHRRRWWRRSRVDGIAA